MRYKGRVDRLSKAIDEVAGTGDGFRYIWKTPSETEEECLHRHGLDADFPGLTVYIVRWSEGEPD